MSIRPVRVTLVTLALLALARVAAAQCTGSCSAEITAAPKSVEKYVKKRLGALASCGKRGTPVCPAACPVPDGTADPYALSQTCVDLLDCETNALAESFYDTSWDDALVCPTSPATVCGNARAKGGVNVVVKKLIRRRTGKMDKYSKDVASCVKQVDKAGACGGVALCNDGGDFIDDILPITVPKNGYETVPFTVAADGEGVATLSLAAVSADWSQLGRESVVLSYDLDGSVLGTIVVSRDQPTDYRVLLGAVTAGDHTIGLRQEKKLSPASDSPVEITASASVVAIQPGDPLYDPTRFAPVLLGIDTDLNAMSLFGNPLPGNAVSDSPLVVYARPIPHAGYTTYVYVMIWSNEDGGTGQFPDVLIARWGRTTDIENIVEVDVDNSGNLTAVRYRPDESGNLANFAGVFEAGTHPVLRTSTPNGLIADDGESTLRFAIAPFLYNDAGLPRELGMDLYPVSYEIMAKEMVREDKIEPLGNPSSKKLSDARNYLYLDYSIDVNVSGQVLRGIAVVNGVTYYSDHNQSFNAAVSPRIPDGVGRTAIELPPGTAIGDIQQYGIQGIGTMSGTLSMLNAFVLQADYLPSTRLTFSGSQFQSGANPTWTVTP